MTHYSTLFVKTVSIDLSGRSHSVCVWQERTAREGHWEQSTRSWVNVSSLVTQRANFLWLTLFYPPCSSPTDLSLCLSFPLSVSHTHTHTHTHAHTELSHHHLVLTASMRQPLEGTVMRLYPFNNLIQGQSCLYCSLVTLQQKVRTMLTSSAWMRRGHYCTHAAMIWTWRLIEKNIHNRLVFGCIRRFFTIIIQIIQRLQVVLLSPPLSQRQPDHFPFFFFSPQSRETTNRHCVCVQVSATKMTNTTLEIREKKEARSPRRP